MANEYVKPLILESIKKQTVVIFSNVILESRYYGIPLVMYRIPWLELTKNKQGLVEIEQNDVKGAANEIIKMLSDAKYKTNVTKVINESQSEKFNENIIEKWDSLFKIIINYRRPTYKLNLKRSID